MAEFKFGAKDDPNGFKVDLDDYEVAIIIQALRRHVALEQVEADNLHNYMYPDDPHVAGAQEMLARAQTLLKDFLKAVR